MIHAEGLTKVYQMGESEVRALDGASFTIEKGEMVAIMPCLSVFSSVTNWVIP